MTYGRKPSREDEPLTLERLTSDGIGVAEYITRHLGQPKLLLWGSSWGAMLGIHMAHARPALFSAYVGAVQLVESRANDKAFYDVLLQRVRAAGDADAVAKLEAIGAPPWLDPRAFGIARRIDRKVEALATDPAPKAWWRPDPQYATPKYEADYEAGEDYSYIQFVGLKGDGISSKIDLYKLGPKFELPVYMVQGEQDLLTMPAPSRRYFDFIQAPRKEFVLVPRTGHDPNQPMIDAQYRFLKMIGDCR